jgi:hypothetical protein
MNDIKSLIQKGGLFHFTTLGQGNILKDFMTFSKYAGYRGRFEFNFVDDHNHFETDASIKEYLFREITNDIENFDYIQALEQRHASHLNEFLFKRYDLEDSIKQVDYATAKLFSILKAFLAPAHKLVFINMDKINFAPGLNERIARIIRREIDQKQRAIIIYGAIPSNWKEFQVATISQGPKRNFHISKISQAKEEQNIDFQEFEDNKHAA